MSERMRVVLPRPAHAQACRQHGVGGSSALTGQQPCLFPGVSTTVVIINHTWSLSDIVGFISPPCFFPIPLLCRCGLGPPESPTTSSLMYFVSLYKGGQMKFQIQTDLPGSALNMQGQYCRNYRFSTTVTARTTVPYFERPWSPWSQQSSTEGCTSSIRDV